jgi:hypothetical protein
MSIAAITISNRRIAARAFQLQFGYTPERSVISKAVGRYPIGGTMSETIPYKPIAPTIVSPNSGAVINSSQSSGVEYSISRKAMSRCFAYLIRFTIKRNGILVADMRIIDDSEESFEPITVNGVILFPQVIQGSPAGDWTIEAFALSENREIAPGSAKVNFTVI